MWANIALIIGAYLFGSLPYMSALSKARGVDLSPEEDFHIALWRKAGRVEGVSGILVDLSKGIIPVLLGFGFSLPLAVVATAGVAGVAGQMWPVFQKFDGEKGNSTGLAMVATLALAYKIYSPIVIALIPIVLGALIRTLPRFFAANQTLNERFKFGGPASRSLPLGMAIGFAVMPIVAWWLHQPLEVTLALAVLFVIIMIRRLTAGITADLKTATSITSILINRFLYDRSYL